VAGQWLSLGTLVSSINTTDCHDITEIMLKVALNTINLYLVTKWKWIIRKRQIIPVVEMMLEVNLDIYQ
jgi:hypothetical protein